MSDGRKLRPSKKRVRREHNVDTRATEGTSTESIVVPRSMRLGHWLVLVTALKCSITDRVLLLSRNSTVTAVGSGYDIGTR